MSDWKQRALAIRDKIIQLPWNEWSQQLKEKSNKLMQKQTFPLVGLDISSDYIKVVKIDQTKTPNLVETFTIESIPPGAITKEGIKDFATVSNVIRTAFKSCNIETNHIALAIPRSLAIIKVINIDSRLNLSEIESRAWVEAHRNFPELAGETYLDFVVLGNSAQEKNQLEVLLVACRKEQIKPYLEVCKQAGLNADIIDINCYALERTVPLLSAQLEKLETFAILNLNTNLSTLIVIQNGSMIYSNDQSFDGVRLITQTEKFIKEASAAQKEVTDAVLEADAAYNEILKESLISHIRHTIHFFYSSKPNISIQKVLISGDCADVPCLAGFVQREIGADVQIANLSESLGIAENINADVFKHKSPALLQCCGLALSKLDI